MKNTFVLFLFLGLLQTSYGQKTESGLIYLIIEDVPGETAKQHDAVRVSMSIKNDKRNWDHGVTTKVLDDLTLQLNEALTLLSEGDSAHFKFRNDLFYGDGIADGLNPNGITELHIRVLKITRRAEVEKMQEEKALKKQELKKQALIQFGKDTLKIKEYLEARNIKAQRTTDGVYYVIKESGKGKKVEFGDSVVVHYSCILMSNEFEVFATTKDKEPLTFEFSPDSWIKGWADIFKNILKEGDAVRVYIPAYFAYGDESIGEKIKPNENLIFDIEVLKVKKNN
jgi:FKBP-type peptidyl-prolyl cis-trans isomerase